LKIILRDADKSGLEIHHYSNYMGSFKPKSSDRILHILNPLAIKELKELQHVPEVYTDSYQWLLIGLCIGQRVSDNLKLRPNTLRKAPTGLYIDILQQKTKKAGTVGVADPLVIELLKNEFPRRVSQVVFHKQIKALCKMAGINELISRFKNNPKTRRKKIVNTPKYKFVTHLLYDVLLHLTIMVKLKHRCL
jgi:hypothetical protein